MVKGSGVWSSRKWMGVLGKRLLGYAGAIAGVKFECAAGLLRLAIPAHVDAGLAKNTARLRLQNIPSGAGCLKGVVTPTRRHGNITAEGEFQFPNAGARALRHSLWIWGHTRRRRIQSTVSTTMGITNWATAAGRLRRSRRATPGVIWPLT